MFVYLSVLVNDQSGKLDNIEGAVEMTKDERDKRYGKDSDIIRADTAELGTNEKVFLLATRILNDKLSLPGFVYRYLIV